MDITDRQEIENVLSVASDVIIHGAAMTYVDECKHKELAYNLNVVGTKIS